MSLPRSVRASRRSGAAILIVVTAHLMIGAALLHAPAPPPSPSDAGPILVTLVSEPRAATAASTAPKRPKPSRPPPSAETAAPPQPPPPEAQPEAASASAPELAMSGQGWIVDVNAPCDVLGGVQQRLQDDPAALDALQALPVDNRSVANAVMLWDGTWRQDGPARPIAALRAALQRALTGAPPACLAADNIGPRLIMLRDGRGTTLLAVGSGAWTWAQLTIPAEATLVAVK
ncbi:hypothetical protein [Caulobacter sp. SSI4214]|uniref:hypothetical protein n=1 Tax=Caulobacter sp. SSI4214 TaxID=2575739 RepID=UPI00143BC057|nr:hypothetical protein [Caulobacter sp. SSI4214]